MTAIAPTPRNLLIALSLDPYLEVDWLDDFSTVIEIGERTRPDLRLVIRSTQVERNAPLPTTATVRAEVYDRTFDDNIPTSVHYVLANVDAIRQFIDSLPAGATDPAFDPKPEPEPKPRPQRIVTVAGILFEDPDEPMADAFTTYDQAIDYIASVENLDRDEGPLMSADTLVVEQIATMEGIPKMWQIRSDETYSGRYYRIYENYLNPVL